MDLVEHLAGLVGFYKSYKGTFGDEVESTPKARELLLSSMGYGVECDELANTIKKINEKNWLNPVPLVHVVTEGIERCFMPISLPINEQLSVSWRIITENGHKLSDDVNIEASELLNETTINDVHYGQYKFFLPDLVQGYHELFVIVNGQEFKCPLIFAPKNCFSATQASTNKVWGFTAQLYSLRSESNWGIGDFSDLNQLVQQSLLAGASVVGINPLHPLYQNNPAHRSPYSPSSRCFLNPLYIDVTNIINYKGCQEAKDLVSSEQFQNRMISSKNSELIDYIGVSELKYEVIEVLFNDFCNKSTTLYTEEAHNFLLFKQEHGEELLEFATFDALFEHFRAIDENNYGWTDWPESYQNPKSNEVMAFQKEYEKRIDYFCFVQWVAHTQLNQVKENAQQNGMKIGLYLDLAVGCDGAGAEVWSDQASYLAGASIGAPPDGMNPLGQNWGLTPMNPVTLRAKGYKPLIKALRSNMRYSGALRIDHILGLLRQYWIAPGMNADEGIYISFPIDEILSVIALESQRNQCIVIGEDLGNVPDGFTDLINNAGLLSFKVMFFERWWESGLFKRPNEFNKKSVVTVATHDTATLAGWWTGKDLEWREKLDIYPTKEAGEDDRNSRNGDRKMLIDALNDLNVIDMENLPQQSPPIMNTELTLAVQKYLAKAPSHIQLIPMEDALECVEQVNIPGTIDEHPNWLQKLPVTLDEFWATDSVIQLVETMTIARPKWFISISSIYKASLSINFITAFIIDTRKLILRFTQ